MKVELISVEKRRRTLVAILRVGGKNRTVRPGGVVYGDVTLDEIRLDERTVELSDGRKLQGWLVASWPHV
jgi:hypothetical protein